MRRWLAILALTLAIVQGAAGQALPGGAVPEGVSAEDEQTLRRLLAKSPNQWTDADSKAFADTLFRLVVEGVTEYLPPEERAFLGDVEIEIGSWPGQASATMVGHTLRLQEEYFFEIFQLAGLLAHDLHVEHLGWLPNPQPLLTKPWAQTPLIRVLRPLHGYIDSMFQFWTSCPRELASCETLLTATAGAAFAFIASHELGHRILGYSGSPHSDYPLEQERAADRWALRVLDRLRQDLGAPHEDFATALELVFAAAPLLMLENAREYSLDRKNGDAPTRRTHALAARLEAFADELPERLREDALDLVQAETSDENAGRLRIVWEETPDLLVVDGQRVPPEEVKGRALRVAGGRHVVFARAGERFAFSRVYSWTPETEAARLSYRGLVAPESIAELARLEDEREWLEILVRTSRVDLTPASGSTARLHLKALRRMGLGGWVDGEGWGMLSGSELLRAGRVQAGSRALAGWWR